MQEILLVVQLILASALIGVVLLQRSESDGFGLGSGNGSNFMSGRASANLLTRTTAVLAALFIINSLVLSIVASRQGHESIVDTVNKQEQGVPSPVSKTDPALNNPANAKPTPDVETVTVKKDQPVKAVAKPVVPSVPKVPVQKLEPTKDTRVDAATPAKVEAPAADAKPAVPTSDAKPVEPTAEEGKKQQ